jgi:hypothetical protein
VARRRRRGGGGEVKVSFWGGGLPLSWWVSMELRCRSFVLPMLAALQTYGAWLPLTGVRGAADPGVC